MKNEVFYNEAQYCFGREKIFGTPLGKKSLENHINKVFL
jgi:hypothetical protein